MATFRQQLQANSVALISLSVAFIALSYNTWRNETTEAQRNIRQAAFRVLESLGDLQEVADYRYYYLPFDDGAASEGELRLRGYGSVTMVRDLMNLMPDPAPVASDRLFRLWNEHVNDLTGLDENGRHSAAAVTAEQELSAAISDTRKAVITVLRQLE